MTGFRSTSMRHVGMTREAMREVVKKKLIIGQQCVIENCWDVKEAGRRKEYSRCTLTGFSRNFAVFRHTGKKTTETVTYQELWTMLMAGEISR